MSSDEGGVRVVSPSSSVRRTRSSRGTLTGTADELAAFDLTEALAAFFWIAFFFVALGFGRAGLADFLTGACFFLADAFGFAVRFLVARAAERPADRFRPDLAGAARRAALRLAIPSVLSEP